MLKIGESTVTTMDHRQAIRGGKIVEIKKGTKVIIGYRFTGEAVDDFSYTIIDPVTNVEIRKVLEI